MATEKRIVVNGISLRRDTEAKYLSVADRFIPKKGEVCLVDTEFYGLRVKVGNGVDNFKTLSYQDNNNNVILNGYFLNNKFYTDSTYTKELEQGINHLYIDKNYNGSIFVWTGTEFRNVAPEATDTVAGLVKLYNTKGQNIDGSVTQQLFTSEIDQKIEMKVDLGEETIIFGYDL